VFLKSLELFAYRNHAQAALSFTSPVQLFVGPNARGKTNLVEAVYVLATGRSFRRSASSRDLIQAGANEASIRGELFRDDLVTDLRVRLTGTGRKLFINANEVNLLRDYVRHASVVAFQPEDLLMVRGGPELRREFMDRAAFSLYPDYLDEHSRYSRSLAERNQLLKDRGPAGHLAAWTEELAETGARLAGIRGRFLKELLPEAELAFREIFGPLEIQIHYDPSPSGLAGIQEGERKAFLLEELAAREADDRIRGFTGIGPHRDDLRIMLDGRGARQFASQGQTRALALALRIAQIRHGERILGSPPLFILDDVGSELDAGRREFLAQFLNKSKVQAFITATEANLLPAIGDAQIWSLESAPPVLKR
jgi:DNA replication and repair protein RecF